jgi:hypothetical protein
MINLKLKALLLTILCVIGISGFGFLFYTFHSQVLSVMIGIICLIFIKHIYTAIEYSIIKDK